MLIHRRVTSSCMSPVPIYTPRWRETMWGKVSCLRKQHDGRDWLSNHQPSLRPYTILHVTCPNSARVWSYTQYFSICMSGDATLLTINCCTNIFHFIGPMQVAVTSIVIFVILPLTLVGTVLGRNLNGAPNVPCRVNTVPRPIPEKKW